MAVTKKRLNFPHSIQALLGWFIDLAAKGGPAIRDRVSEVLLQQQISGLTFAERFMLGETQVWKKFGVRCFSRSLRCRWSVMIESISFCHFAIAPLYSFLTFVV